MERIAIRDIQNNVYNIGDNLTSNAFVLDCSNCDNSITINVPACTRIDILIINIKDNSEIRFNLSEGASIQLGTLAKGTINTLNIYANLEKNAEFHSYLADFIDNQNTTKVEVNLNDEGAVCDWHLASLASKTDKKEFDVSVFHKAINTYAKLDNYGVCKDEAKLTFSGICKIANGARGSKAHQNAKIMVFDEKSNGVAKPILKIDENDIEASHAAVVGKINDDHLFYLTSRGLTEAEAKELITLGYLNPILNGFSDEEIKNDIANMIERRM